MTSSSWLTPYRPYKWLPATPLGFSVLQLKFGTATRSVTQRCSITTWLVHHDGPVISHNVSQFAKQPIEFKDFRVFKVICYFLLLRSFVLVTRGYHFITEGTWITWRDPSWSPPAASTLYRKQRGTLFSALVVTCAKTHAVLQYLEDVLNKGANRHSILYTNNIPWLPLYIESTALDL